MSEEKAQALAPTRARNKVSNHSKNTKWTQEDDDLLLKLIDGRTNINWADFCPAFEGKSPQQIAERWEKVLNPALVKGSWTRDEDEIIIKFVQEHGTKNWTKLATLLPGRIGKQCRERWRNHLDPEVNHNPWNAEEDQILIEMHEKIGNQWVKIAELLPGRSDNAVKNRWNSTLKKRLEYANSDMPRPKRGRPSMRNHPKSADDVPKPPRFEEITSEIKEMSTTVTPQFLTPNLLSPFTSLKSPFGMMSPMIKEMAGFNSSWSPAKDQKDFDTFSGYSPNLFSPSLKDNREEMMNLLSPLFKKL